MVARIRNDSQDEESVKRSSIPYTSGLSLKNGDMGLNCMSFKPPKKFKKQNIDEAG